MRVALEERKFLRTVFKQLHLQQILPKRNLFTKPRQYVDMAVKTVMKSVR